MMELVRRFAMEAPELRTFSQDKPTLLVSWWCTGYALTIILFRVCGRYIRTERAYAEDGIMLLAIAPLLARAAFAHVVMLYGTNNTNTFGLTGPQIRHRELGSQLVLASRVFYTAYLWTIKYSISLYLRSLTESVWQKSHQRMLRYLHFFLLATFLASIIATLGSCQPFTHNWQVIPDPGPKCRLGYAQLITMGTLNILTNLALVIFPVPMILRSRLTGLRKFSILLRMSLPLLSVIFTTFALPSIVSHQSSQHYRTLIASFDILLATATSNAHILGSILQDRGFKKGKFKHGGENENSVRRRQNAMWGSDEDLMHADGRADKEFEGGIGMDVLDADGKEMVTGKRSRESDRGPAVPPKAKFPIIRVESAWEVHVDYSAESGPFEKD